MNQYKSALKYSKTEYIVEKSKFIAHVKPIATEEEAIVFIEGIKKEHRKANHNVPVYSIKDKVQKYSDDGEPSKTAGFPVLEMLKKENITNVAIVVTRYFGGIKLGKGGLIRAYTKSAKLGLETSEMIEYIEVTKVALIYEYTLHGKIENFILKKSDVHEINTEFLENIRKEVYVPSEKAENFEKSLIELTNSMIIIEEIDSEFVAFSDDKKCTYPWANDKYILDYNNISFFW